MNISHDDLKKLENQRQRDKAQRELDINLLIDSIEKMLALFDDGGPEDISWALEGLSDKSFDLIAANMAELASLVELMENKYSLVGE